MTTITCLQCGGEVNLGAEVCPSCGHRITAAVSPSGKIKARLLKPTKTVGVLLVALSLAFFVTSYMSFSGGEMDSTIIYSIVGLALGIWGIRAFGIML